MRTILKDLKADLGTPYPFLCWAFATFILAIIGPFGTYDHDPLWFRLLFWSSILSLAIIYALFCIHAVRCLRPKWGFHRAAIVGDIFFVVTYSIFIIRLINNIYTIPLPSPLLVVSIIASTTALVSFIILKLELRADIPRETPPKQKTDPQKDETNPFLKRINIGNGTKLIRLAMRDHYVEAHTCKGMQLIHMRLSDAIAALSELNGQQIHRSHWVNLDEVTGTLKKDGKLFFTMSDGFSAPISRSKVNHLKDLNLLR